MILLGIPVQWRKILAFAIDVPLALLAVYVAHVLRLSPTGVEVDLLRILDVSTGAAFLFVTTHTLVLYVFGAYELDQDFRRGLNLFRLWVGIGVAFLLLIALFYAVPNWAWGRGITGLSTLFYGLLVTVWRIALQAIDGSPVRKRRVVIVGGGPAAELVVDAIRQDRGHRSVYELAGWLDDGEAAPSGEPLPQLGTPLDVGEALERSRADLVVVACHPLDREVGRALLHAKAHHGASVVDAATLYKALTGRLPIHILQDSWILFGPDFSGRTSFENALTRLADVFVSVVGLVVLSPLLLVSAVAILLTDGAPVFFTQERLGLGAKPFTILKLRTMYVDAERKTGAVWSQGSGDPRVTPIGRILRRTRLDEVPQFWNVIRGDMGLIGPRPERAHFVDELEEAIPFYGLRFAVKPGLTGWAQVMYRYGASVEDARIKLEYELYAIQEMNPALYALIVLKTVQTVLFKAGS